MRHRRLWAGALVLAIACSAGLALAWSQRCAIAERLLLDRLRAAGIADATLRVSAVTLGALQIRDLRVGAGDLGLPGLELRYSVSGLLRGRLDALRAEGLTLHAEWSGGELHLGALDALRAPARSQPQASPGGASALRLPLLPIERVEIPSARLQLDSPWGALQATGSAELDAAKGGQLALHSDSLGALGLEARDLDLEARFDPVSRLAQASLAVGVIHDLERPARFPPLALHADFSPERAGEAFEARLSAARGRVLLHATGVHDLASGSGHAQLHLDPVRFARDGLRPGDLLPALAQLIPSAQGKLEGHGELRWAAGAPPTGSIDLGLRDLALDTAVARIEQLDAAVHVEGPWPPRIPPGQLVSMARLDFGLELTNGLIRFGMTRPGVIDVQSAEWHFAGGRVLTQGRIDLSARERHIELRVEDVDLHRLLALVNLDGLSGEGRLQGRLPLTLRDGRVEIHKAVLESSGEGWIRYRPKGGAEALGLAGQALDDLLQALRDFHYRRLSLAMDGDAEEELAVKVSLSGENPAHREAQPYNLNLNVEGRLGDLIRQGASAYEIPAKIEKKLGEISKKRH